MHSIWEGGEGGWVWGGIHPALATWASYAAGHNRPCRRLVNHEIFQETRRPRLLNVRDGCAGVNTDTAGLGIGETSASETWTAEVTRAPDHYFENPKNDVV